MGRTSLPAGLLPRLDEVVLAVGADLEDREVDTALHVSGLLERDRPADDRGLEADLVEVLPCFAPRDLAVGTCQRDRVCHRLHGYPGRDAERDRVLAEPA